MIDIEKGGNTEKIQCLMKKILKRGIKMRQKTIRQYPDLLTVKETAEILRCSLKSIYTYINHGDIYSVKIGGRYYVPKSKLFNIKRY